MLSNQSKNQVLIEAKTPSKIPYSDKPLAEDGEIIYLTHEEFKRKFKCEYTESLVGNIQQLKTLIGDVKLSDDDYPDISLIHERLNQPLNAFVICKINDEVGHGLFASQDIPAGTVLFIYAGVPIDSQSKTKDGGYCFNLVENTHITVDSMHIGGLARFMQHLPADIENSKKILKSLIQNLNENELEKKIVLENTLIKITNSNSDRNSDSNSDLNNITFTNIETRNNLATCNVSSTHRVIDGIPVIVFINPFSIKKNSIIGFPYGEKYWNVRPKLFTVEGKMVEKSDYYYKSDVKLANKIDTLLDSMSPGDCYEKAEQFFVDKKQYENALLYLKQAIKGYISNDDSKSENVFDCYILQAYCYRELKQFNQARASMEAALYIAYNSKLDHTSWLKTEYHKVLSLSQLPAMEIYKDAISNFNNKQYAFALNQLQFALEQFKKQNNSLFKKAKCYVALASCYRQMGEFDEGIECCKMVKALYRDDKSNAGIELFKEAESKLKHIEYLQKRLSCLQAYSSMVKQHIPLRFVRNINVFFNALAEKEINTSSRETSKLRSGV